eukprot:6261970-Prorocentrum_lima.AAC.1
MPVHVATRCEDTMGILSDRGFINALALALSIQPRGGSPLAIVCSTWVWVNQGTSGRSQTRP